MERVRGVFQMLVEGAWESFAGPPMGLRRAEGGLPERCGVLGEPCGACLGDHLGSKDGPRRFRFSRTLFASFEAGHKRMLGDEKWNKLA